MDVGGGATAEMVENELRIILKDSKMKAVLINIFGGILCCDVFAEGVVQAAKSIGVTVPLVVRMEGTNVDEGKRILAESGLNLVSAVDLKDAAAKTAAAVYASSVPESRSSLTCSIRGAARYRSQPQTQNSVQVDGHSLPDGDFHSIRSTGLCLAH